MAFWKSVVFQTRFWITLAICASVLNGVAGCVALYKGINMILEPAVGRLFNLLASDFTPFRFITQTLLGLIIYGLCAILNCFFVFRVMIRLNRGGLRAFMITLGALAFFQIITTLSCGMMNYFMASNLESRLTSKLAMDYGRDWDKHVSFSNSFDDAQYTFHCCGVYDDRDYENMTWWKNKNSEKQVPSTCCILSDIKNKITSNPMNIGWDRLEQRTDFHKNHSDLKNISACQKGGKDNELYRYKEGCLVKLIDWMLNKFFILLHHNIAMVVSEIFMILFSYCLYRTKGYNRNVERSYSDRSLSFEGERSGEEIYLPYLPH